MIEKMVIKIILHSILRDKLPPEAHGRTQLDFPDHSTIADVMAALDISSTVVFSVNDQLERNIHRVLQEGDELRFLRQSTGG
jgi:sulfur carrier protein ThiS